MEENYYGEFGCCLNCENAEPGCLCYNCKCTKCSYYIPPEEWNWEKGKCSITLRSKAERIKYYDCPKPKAQPPKPNVKTIKFNAIERKEDWVEI